VSKGKVLLVDDKANIVKLLQKILGEAYVTETASDGSEALARLADRNYDVVVSDIRMPGADGFEVLRHVKEKSPDTEVVLMTAFASIDKAVEAIKLGAYDYLQKPFDPDDVALVIARALERKSLRGEAKDLRRALSIGSGFHRLVGRSPAMLEVYQLIERAGTSDISVLLLGETGTGKELAARALHEKSGRSSRRFVPVNCGALPGELIESELFGHAKGAFTGANLSKPGLFEEAQGGTLFLDEIGELPLGAQVKLNRALQEREIRPVGHRESIAIDVRIVAATHRDLRKEVEAGRFREDLYYRLNVFPIRLPNLRDRREDIALLAGHFLEKHRLALGRGVEGIDPEALRAMFGYAWPGNVRELEHAIQRAIAVAKASIVALEDLPDEIRGPMQGPLLEENLVKLPYREAVELTRDRVSKEYLTALMREFGGHVTRAAERAGMERESLHRLVRRYGLHPEDFRRAGDSSHLGADDDDR
jgi:DNA-binding NtrC family response regulator